MNSIMFEKEVKAFYLQKFVSDYPSDSVDLLKSAVSELINEEWFEDNLVGEKEEVISMLMNETNCSREESEMNFREISNDGEFILGFAPFLIETFSDIESSELIAKSFYE